MEPRNYIITDGRNADFIYLCGLLDKYLSEISGVEDQWLEYIPYNMLEDIDDVILAYYNNIPIGCASFKYYSNDIAEIKRVFLLKEYRGKGISKEIIEMVEKRAAEKGYRKLILESAEPLKEAMNLYKKMGYEVRENYEPYTNIKESICMEKYIS